ncbi:MAG: UDP-N-acetylmuramate--L-alanine ligase [Prevotella sp.]|nr:UDP-N-acetylmuramate--L-alanine ligase [Prevotella sp.]
MQLKDIKSVYFIGAGGIGMSAIARYFLHQGLVVAGYDKTPTPLTDSLAKEGMAIHFSDDVSLIPEACKDADSTLVVYTPAIPISHSELTFFRDNGFELQKRAQVLGTLAEAYKALCVAGTHGKTTTSAMLAHIMHESTPRCNAFLGGISKNYGTNYLLADSDFVVLEADEYDRSFHWLRPWVSVITAVDADHLDIYGTEEAYRESFRHYTSLIREGGALVIHSGVNLTPAVADGVTVYTYGEHEGDFHAENICIDNGEITFDFISPMGNITGVNLGQPIPINVDNGVAAMAVAQISGCSAEEIRDAMATFAGVDRRFDFKVRTPRHVLLSDYAHHPKEIYQSARSIRELYKDRKITVIFQPHLYTRTRDFYQDFAASLSLLDEVVLCDIYPAREEPIPGVSERLIYDHLGAGVKKQLIRRADVIDFVKSRDFDVLLILGAGDLDNEVPQIAQLLLEKEA